MEIFAQNQGFDFTLANIAVQYFLFISVVKYTIDTNTQRAIT